MINKQPVIGITMGDPAGIGPEIIVKALHDDTVAAICRPVVFGDRGVLERQADRLGLSCAFETVISTETVSTIPGTIAILEVSRLDPSCVRCGSPTAESGKAMTSAFRQCLSEQSRRPLCRMGRPLPSTGTAQMQPSMPR